MKNINGPLKVGIGGPVGAGKTSLTAELCKFLSKKISMAVCTNKQEHLAIDLLKKIGIFPIRNHYYEPLFKNDFLKLDFERSLPGINLNIEKQIKFLDYPHHLKSFRLDLQEFLLL